MGFSSSAATIVLLIALMVSMANYVPTMMESKEEQAMAIDGLEDEKKEAQNTDINVTMVSCTDPVEVNASNEGSTSWRVQDLDLLLDGNHIAPSQYTTSVDGNAKQTLVMPGETITFNVSGLSTSRGKVVTEYGVSDTRAC